MRGCARVGLELSWRCNVDCATCFYHHDERLHKPIDTPWEKLKDQIDRAKKRGCDHAVAVGWGEPAIAPSVRTFLQYSRTLNMTTSIITNGVCGIKRYETFFTEDNIDHLHVSAHGMGEVLDEIFDSKGSHKKQDELKKWLKESGRPWRANITLQQLNHKQLPELVDNLIEHGALHVILLGFLPHYAWEEPAKCKTVAVHPAVLQPIVEQCIDKIVAAGRFATLRYHPFCFLRPEYWKYVTNARYVMLDPWEWDYEHYDHDVEKVWPHAVNQGNVVAVQGEPCKSCAMNLHCGGWNKHNVTGLGVDLKKLSISDIPSEFRASAGIRGFWHDQNPANQAKGYFGKLPNG